MARRAKDLDADEGGETGGRRRKGRMGKVAGERQDAAPLAQDEGTLQHHGAILAAALGEIEEKAEEMASLRGVYQNARKAAKKVGIDVDAWKRAWDLKKREPGEVIAEHRHTIEWLRRMGAPVGTQFALFEDIEVKSTVDPEAAGFHAGKNGETGLNPYQTGSKEAQDWQAGWLRGQKIITDGMKAAKPTGGANGSSAAPGEDFEEDAEPPHKAAAAGDDGVDIPAKFRRPRGAKATVQASGNA